MKINYLKFMKHAAKVTKGVSEARPVLKGVNHAENYVATTDSHRLYIAYDVNAPKNAVIDPVSGNEIDAGNFPDVERLLPYDDDMTGVLTFSNINKTVKQLKAMLAAGRAEGLRADNIFAAIIDGHIELSKIEDVCFTIKANDGGQAVEERVAFRLQYLIEALEMFVDMNIDSVIVRTCGSKRPFTIKAERFDDLTALIMPIRE